MKTTVTTREFDDKGRCVKETVCEYDYTAPAAYPAIPTVTPYWHQPNWCTSAGTLTTGSGDSYKLVN